MQIFHEDGQFKVYLAGRFVGAYATQDEAIQAGYDARAAAQLVAATSEKGTKP